MRCRAAPATHCSLRSLACVQVISCITSVPLLQAGCVVNGSLVTGGHAVTNSTYGIVSGLDLCAEDLRVEVNGRQLTVSGRRPVLPAQGRAVAPAIHYTDQGE